MRWIHAPRTPPTPSPTTPDPTIQPTGARSTVALSIALDGISCAEFGDDEEASLVTALATEGKHERGSALKSARNALIAKLVEGVDSEEEAARLTGEAKTSWETTLRSIMRTKVAEEGVRIDGRATDEIRAIAVEVGVAVVVSRWGWDCGWCLVAGAGWCSGSGAGAAAEASWGCSCG